MRTSFLAALTILCLGVSLPAQSPLGKDTVVVMTVPLKYIPADVAVQLLTPYATTPGYTNQPAGGVWAVPGGHAITIRERLPQYGRMVTLIHDYDKPPRELVLTYQVILADRSGRRAREIPSLDSILRSSLKYTGFTLLGTGSVRSRGTGSEESALETDDFQYETVFRFYDGFGTPVDASTRLSVNLSRAPWPVNGLPRGGGIGLLGAENVTIPLGQTVVIGTGVLDRNRAVILTVRPELASNAKGRED